MQLVYRTKTPEQHALFLRTASDINFDFIQTEDAVQTQLTQLNSMDSSLLTWLTELSD